jgi:hypothetical protein
MTFAQAGWRPERPLSPKDELAQLVARVEAARERETGLGPSGRTDEELLDAPM